MLRYQPTADARNVRRRTHHPTILPVAPLAHGGLCAQAYFARAAPDTPRYETVVVAAAENARADGAASSSVITTDRTPRAAESVTRLLSEQSGATVTRLGGMGAAATVSLRGSTANQVSVYLDGVPLNSAVGGGVDLGSLPVSDVERIEIYRGMSPIAFGASAIGGVVSISTAAGNLVKDACIHSGTGAPKLSMTLSEDLALPSQMPSNGPVVIIDKLWRVSRGGNPGELLFSTTEPFVLGSVLFDAERRRLFVTGGTKLRAAVVPIFDDVNGVYQETGQVKTNPAQKLPARGLWWF